MGFAILKLLFCHTERERSISARFFHRFFAYARAIRKDFTHTCKNDKIRDFSPFSKAQNDKILESQVNSKSIAVAKHDFTTIKIKSREVQIYKSVVKYPLTPINKNVRDFSPFSKAQNDKGKNFFIYFVFLRKKNSFCDDFK